MRPLFCGIIILYPTCGCRKVHTGKVRICVGLQPAYHNEFAISGVPQGKVCLTTFRIFPLSGQAHRERSDGKHLPCRPLTGTWTATQQCVRRTPNRLNQSSKAIPAPGTCKRKASQKHRQQANANLRLWHIHRVAAGDVAYGGIGIRILQASRSLIPIPNTQVHRMSGRLPPFLTCP